METATLAAIASLVLAALVVPLAVIVLRPDDHRRLRGRPTVLVVLKSGETIRGALLARRRTSLELGRAEVLAREGNTAIDGTVHVDRANVAWIQRPGA